MAFVIKDRVWETSTTTGTSNINLDGGPVDNYLPFNILSNGDKTYYTIVNNSKGEWEVGIGTYDSANDRLSRDTILATHSGLLTKVNFSAGSKDVFCGLPATRTITLDTLDKDPDLSADSDAIVSSQRAIKSYIDLGLANKVNTTTTVNGNPLSSNITLDKTDIGLSNVDNTQQLPLSYLDTDGDLTSNSDTKVPSQKAVKTYVDGSKTFIDVKDFGAVGDGITDDTVALQAAIDSTLFLFWPEGTYKISASLDDFWDREHTGYGKITRSGETFYITPREDELNIIYSGAPHSRTADGFTVDHAIHIDEAIKRIRKIGNKAQDGRWRIQMFGMTGASGVTLEGLPIFRNRLEIWGEAADDVSAVPTTVWDGTSSDRMYAIRGDWNYNSANFFLHFKNIKFINWNKSSNAGAIVIWGSGDVLSENIHVDSCSVGEWYRQNYVRILGGKANNCQTWGIGIQYGASGNVGNLSGKGKVFTNCSTGVAIGRNTTVYIQGCDLSGDTLIEVNRNSRIRTQGNTYRAWTNCVVYASLVGVWTVDNGQGSPDTYLQTPSGTAPVMRCESGSIHQHLQRFSGNVHLINATGSNCSISGTTASTLLSAVAGVTPGEWVPARVPAWWAYSPSARLIVKLFMQHNNPHAGGVLELKGAGSSGSLLLAKLTVAPNGSYQAGWITMEFMTRGTSSTGRYFTEYKSNMGNVVNSGSTSSLNNSLIRDASENALLYRLYWTPNDSSDTVLFTDMHSYIEV